MDKLPLFKFFLCCREVGDMDDKQYARTISLLVEDDDFAANALIALEKRLADYSYHVG